MPTFETYQSKCSSYSVFSISWSINNRSTFTKIELIFKCPVLQNRKINLKRLFLLVSLTANHRPSLVTRPLVYVLTVYDCVQIIESREQQIKLCHEQQFCSFPQGFSKKWFYCEVFKMCMFVSVLFYDV
jgi:hypothetical protein